MKQKNTLAMIALFQFLALTWGVWNTYNERPAALIYTLDFFTPVPAYQLAEQGMTTDKLKQFGDSWPILIYIDIPKDQISQVISEAMHAGKPLYLLTERYKKFTKEQAPALKENSMKLLDIIEKPSVEEAPSCFANFGRMILNQDIINILKEIPLGKGEELWLTDAIQEYVKRGGEFYAKKVEDGEWLTTGDPLNYLKTTLKYAFDRKDIGEDILEYINKSICKR